MALALIKGHSGVSYQTKLCFLDSFYQSWNLGDQWIVLNFVFSNTEIFHQTKGAW